MPPALPYTLSQMNAAGARPSATSCSICSTASSGIPHRLGAAVLAAEAVGGLDRVHPIRPGGKRIGVVGGRRGHRVRAVRPAVIGLAHRDHVAPARRRRREPDRQIACLRAGVDQKDGVQRIGQHGGEPLAELDHRLVVEPRVRVELAQLPGGGVGDPRVGMAQHRHVVDHVEVGATGRRHQVMPPAPLDLRRFAIVKLLHRSETRVAPRQQIACVRHLHGGQPEQRPRIAGQRQPTRRQLGPGQQRRRRVHRPAAHRPPPMRPRALGQRFAGAHAARRDRIAPRKASARNRRPRSVSPCPSITSPSHGATSGVGRRRPDADAGRHDVGAVLAELAGPAQPRLPVLGDDERGRRFALPPWPIRPRRPAAVNRRPRTRSRRRRTWWTGRASPPTRGPRRRAGP